MNTENYNAEEMRKAFTAFTETAAAQDMHSKSVAIVRRIASKARNNDKCRAFTESVLSKALQCFPAIERNVPAFRAMYLDGESGSGAREIAMQLYIDKRTVYRQVYAVLEAMAVIVFGLYGVNWK